MRGFPSLLWATRYRPKHEKRIYNVSSLPDEMRASRDSRQQQRRSRLLVKKRFIKKARAHILANRLKKKGKLYSALMPENQWYQPELQALNEGQDYD